MPAWDGRTMLVRDKRIIDGLLGGKTQAEIARELGIAPQHVTSRIDVWIARGLLERQPPRPLYALTEQWRERWERMGSE